MAAELVCLDGTGNKYPIIFAYLEMIDYDLKYQGKCFSELPSPLCAFQRLARLAYKKGHGNSNARAQLLPTARRTFLPSSLIVCQCSKKLRIEDISSIFKRYR